MNEMANRSENLEIFQCLISNASIILHSISKTQTSKFMPKILPILNTELIEKVVNIDKRMQIYYQLSQMPFEDLINYFQYDQVKVLAQNMWKDLNVFYTNDHETCIR